MHIQAICGAEHQALPGNPALIAAYTDFLTSGRTPRKITSENCSDTGAVVSEQPLFRLAPFGKQFHYAHDTADSSALASGVSGLTLNQAVTHNKVDLVSLHPLLLLLSSHTPVSLRLPASRIPLTVTPLRNGHMGHSAVYGTSRSTITLTETTHGTTKLATRGRTLQPKRRCIVPRLKGRSAASAGTALANAGCQLGTITTVRGARGRLTVSSQSIRPGAHKPAGSTVNIRLS